MEHKPHMKWKRTTTLRITKLKQTRAINESNKSNWQSRWDQGIVWTSDIGQRNLYFRKNFRNEIRERLAERRKSAVGRTPVNKRSRRWESRDWCVVAELVGTKNWGMGRGLPIAKSTKKAVPPKKRLAISRKQQQNTSLYEKGHGWSEKCRSFGTRNTRSVLAEKERHSVNTSAWEPKIAAVCRRNTLQQF